VEVMQHILPFSPREKGLRNEMAVATALPRYELERISVPTDAIPRANCKCQSVLGLASVRVNEITKFADARLRTGGAVRPQEHFRGQSRGPA
jgi:hypothetical protein